MERNMNEKIMQDQADRLTLKKEEVKFLTKEEVEKLKKKYSEPGASYDGQNKDNNSN